MLEDLSPQIPSACMKIIIERKIVDREVWFKIYLLTPPDHVDMFTIPLWAIRQLNYFTDQLRNKGEWVQDPYQIEASHLAIWRRKPLDDEGITINV